MFYDIKVNELFGFVKSKITLLEIAAREAISVVAGKVREPEFEKHFYFGPNSITSRSLI